MKLIYKINLAVIGLLAVSAVLVGAFFVSSFRDLRAETYRWFDASGRQLATSIGGQAREAIGYFDYKTIEAGLGKRLAEDPNLLYASVAFGEGLKDRREAGNADAGVFRTYQEQITD